MKDTETIHLKLFHGVADPIVELVCLPKGCTHRLYVIYMTSLMRFALMCEHEHTYLTHTLTSLS